jgi:type 1 glutamine amidotransferase
MDDFKNALTRSASVLLGAVAAAAAALTGSAALAQAPTNGNLPPGALPSSWDPTYNVCRGTDPKCYRDWAAASRQNRVLIYTRTAGPRHANLGTALAAGMNPPLGANNVVQNSLKSWLEAEGIVVDWTEDVTQVGNNRYKAIIFVSTSRDTMWKHGTAISATAAVNTTTSAHLDAGKTALRQYMRSGGGFVGIHNALGTEYNWPWYEGLLGNTNYFNHGANQNGTVQMVGTAEPSGQGVPATWGFKDEWYNLVPYPTNVKVLATVDESTLASKGSGHPGHGTFHPVSWCQYYDGGRSFVTSLGHDGQAFIDGSGFPGQAEFKRHLVQNIKAAMGLTAFCVK